MENCRFRLFVNLDKTFDKEWKTFTNLQRSSGWVLCGH